MPNAKNELSVVEKTHLHDLCCILESAELALTVEDRRL